MISNNRVSDTTPSTWMRGVSRFGTLCGVLGILALTTGCDPCFNFNASDDDNCTSDTCEVNDAGEATAVHTPVECTDGVCNPDDGECVECLADADCDQGVCSEAGGNVCVECLLDSHCDAGQVCSNGECVAGPECTVDTDCADGQVCTDGACVAGGCTVDTDCDAGQVCTNGECVAGGGTGGDPVAGEAFYTANNCALCHGATGAGPPDIRNESAATIFARLSGVESHPITVAGVTMQDAEDLEAWLSTQ